MNDGKIVTTAWRPSGRRRFRRSWFGKVILQVEEVRYWGCADPRTRLEPGLRGVSTSYRWRDARADDVFGEIDVAEWGGQW